MTMMCNMMMNTVFMITVVTIKGMILIMRILVLIKVIMIMRKKEKW